MSGECEKCGEHCLDCRCKKEDETLRDFLLNTASDMSNISDEPTIMSLNDTIEILEKRNANWANDELCQKILVWQASFFLNSHSDQIIQEKCPHLKEMYIEYREHQTINGKRLHHMFGMKALSYIMPDFEEPYFEGPIGCVPVKDAYFKIEKNDEQDK